MVDNQKALELSIKVLNFLDAFAASHNGVSYLYPYTAGDNGIEARAHAHLLERGFIERVTQAGDGLWGITDTGRKEIQRLRALAGVEDAALKVMIADWEGNKS